MLALAAIFVVAIWNAIAVLRFSADPTERFGTTMIVLTVIVGGLAGMLGGHDILDSTLMVFLISGTYLACGKTIPPVSDGPATSRMTSHHGRPILLNLTPVWRCRPLR